MVCLQARRQTGHSQAVTKKGIKQMTKKIEGMAKAHHTRLIAALLAVSLAAILLVLVETKPAEAAFPAMSSLRRSCPIL